MVHISERKVTIYLPARVQKKLVALAQRNKLKNLRKGVRREDKLPETMGAIVRESLEEYFEKTRKKNEKSRQKEKPTHME